MGIAADGGGFLPCRTDANRFVISALFTSTVYHDVLDRVQVLLSCTVLLLCAILGGQHYLERYKEEHEETQQRSRSARRSTRTRRISNAIVLGEALLFSAMAASIGAAPICIPVRGHLQVCAWPTSIVKIRGHPNITMAPEPQHPPCSPGITPAVGVQVHGQCCSARA